MWIWITVLEEEWKGNRTNRLDLDDRKNWIWLHYCPEWLVREEMSLTSKESIGKKGILDVKKTLCLLLALVMFNFLMWEEFNVEIQADNCTLELRQIFKILPYTYLNILNISDISYTFYNVTYNYKICYILVRNWICKYSQSHHWLCWVCVKFKVIVRRELKKERKVSEEGKLIFSTIQRECWITFTIFT